MYCLFGLSSIVSRQQCVRTLSLRLDELKKTVIV